MTILYCNRLKQFAKGRQASLHYQGMLPVLFTVASFPITSFGLFLILAILAALYIIWRAAQVYEIDPERLLDIFFLTIFSAVFFARLYYIIFHPELLVEPVKVLLINRYPGLSFWGGLLGGALALKFLAGRFKTNLWQILDFAAVGLFLAIAIGSLGCLLGSCSYGVVSDTLRVSQVGIIGERFPIQAFEASLFLIIFFYLWKGLLRFHFAGSIIAKGAIWLGILKFVLEFWRGETQNVPYLNLSFGFIWALVCLILGIYIYYHQSKKSFRSDLKFLLSLPFSLSKQRLLFLNLKRSCYNLVVSFKVGVKNWRKNFLKLFHLKPNPKSF